MLLAVKTKVEQTSARRSAKCIHRWSDGSGTVAEMAAAGLERSEAYLAITDHSKGLKIAGGIDEAALRRQADEIDAANRSLGKPGNKLTVLRSIEMNLNPRGQGDMGSKVIAATRSCARLVSLLSADKGRPDRALSGGHS